MSNKHKLSTRDYILYLLNKIELAKVGKIRLNKLAFFVEFGYIYKTGKQLSETEYAGINLGPVINDYRKILAQMEKDGDVKMEGDRIVPLKNSNLIPDEVRVVIDPLIARFDAQPDRLLVSMSHATDAYKITTIDEKVMGKIIDKSLAPLETAFFDEKTIVEDLQDLPSINRNKLVPYEFG
ncbi:DUF4065 domain-containing protein [Candidatus Woesebacteria bacterium]|nr:DUF4065 domain-containing protein [Candidatus Woesebacteria bacterium]